MALAKRTTKDRLMELAHDDAALDRELDRYLKQDGYYKDSEGLPKLSYHNVTIRHACNLCSLRWTEKRRLPTNVPINPDLVLRHATCRRCHINLLSKSKCELALLLIAEARKGSNTPAKRQSDPTKCGHVVKQDAIKLGS
jgi:hypothetical protein